MRNFSFHFDYGFKIFLNQYFVLIQFLVSSTNYKVQENFYYILSKKLNIKKKRGHVLRPTRKFCILPRLGYRGTLPAKGAHEMADRLLSRLCFLMHKFSKSERPACYRHSLSFRATESSSGQFGSKVGRDRKP